MQERGNVLMIKVLIADDELRICELIFRLIDWEALGMSVIAVAHDGRETIKIIKNEMPDIVITDIRMPGYNGVDVIRIGKEYNSDIQFIIISGYSQFDYAQNAIHYGVSDYLLKPVKAEELTKALLRIKSRIDKNNQMYSQVKKAWTLEQQNRRLYREQLIMEIAHGKGFDVLTKDMNTLNEQYKYEFIPGFFTIVIVKADGLNFEEKTESSFLYEKIQQSLSFAFAPVMQEMQGTMLDNGTYKIGIQITYDEEDKNILRLYIPKLIMQPVVENAIYHGIEQKLGAGQVTISISYTKQNLDIMISDDGIGIKDTELSEINNRLWTDSENYGYEKSEKSGGIAIRNVNQRIKLLFGEEYGIWLNSIYGIGTDVHIKLPVVLTPDDLEKKLRIDKEDVGGQSGKGTGTL